jgi:biopolymer transport protein ExbD
MAGRADDSDSEIVGINVTPLVDITLVLLIIFMVTARLIAQAGLSMDLPKAATGAEVQTVFSVSLAADGRVLVDSTQVGSDDAIGPLAKSAREKNAELRAVIKADSSVSHGRVIHVLDLLKTAGIAKIAFAVTPTAPAPSK